ncbi:hypothetical protein H9P43_003050 [Blastocladiella emersonii ATCC 22665]|nr:hypothetical protein H9P43_003050 [Blastocladiella emersonii ATCC 22665]
MFMLPTIRSSGLRSIWPAALARPYSRVPPTHPTHSRSAVRRAAASGSRAVRGLAIATVVAGTALGAAAAFVPAEPGATVGTRIDTVVRGAVRSACTFAVTASIMADYKWLYWRHGATLGVDSDEYRALRSRVHLRSAESLLWLCRNHGGIYNKAAQHVGSLVKMVPKEYTDTLAVLQDRAPFHDYAEVCRVFQRELGGLPTDFFHSFDETPLAAASLAQVHHAVTLDGRECAVKVQYEDVVRNFAIDLVCMATLTDLVGAVFPEFQLGWIVGEFEANLVQEFDFRVEAHNADATRRRFAHREAHGDFHIPRIFWDLTSQRIMTMEYIHGTRITDVGELARQGFDLPALQHTLIDVFSEMVFVHGIVHCDPHPGNMLVRWDPDRPKGEVTQLVLLDHGLYRTLDPATAFRQTYCDLWVGILTGDDDLLQSVGQRLGPGAAKYWSLFPLMFAGFVRSNSPDAKNQMVLGDSITPEHRTTIRASMRDEHQLTLEAAMDFLEGLPRDMLLVMRTINLVSGVHRAIGGANLPKFRQHAWYAVMGRHRPMRGWVAWLLEALEILAPMARDTEAGSVVVSSHGVTAWVREWLTVWWRVYVVVGAAHVWRDVAAWWA